MRFKNIHPSVFRKTRCARRQHLHKSLAIPKVNIAKIGATNMGIARPSDSFDPDLRLNNGSRDSINRAT